VYEAKYLKFTPKAFLPGDKVSPLVRFPDHLTMIFADSPNARVVKLAFR